MKKTLLILILLFVSLLFIFSEKPYYDNEVGDHDTWMWLENAFVERIKTERNGNCAVILYPQGYPNKWVWFYIDATIEPVGFKCLKNNLLIAYTLGKKIQVIYDTQNVEKEFWGLTKRHTITRRIYSVSLLPD